MWGSKLARTIAIETEAIVEPAQSKLPHPFGRVWA